MESYIVRVYRRCKGDPEGVAGLVETVGSEERQSFQTFSGLVSAIRQSVRNGETKKAEAIPLHLHGKDKIAASK